jgi:hypothetical protein
MIRMKISQNLIYGKRKHCSWRSLLIVLRLKTCYNIYIMYCMILRILFRNVPLQRENFIRQKDSKQVTVVTMC